MLSLNIILRDLYSHSESNNRYFTSDLENKLKQTCTLKLWTYSEPARVLRNKEDITHAHTHAHILTHTLTHSLTHCKKLPWI